MAKNIKGRKFVATAASAALVASAIVPVASAAEFADQSKISSWAADAVAHAVEKGYMKGANGNFNPQGTITKAELAQVLYNALELSPVTDAPFTDVPADAWYATAVNAIAAEGITNGDGNGKFAPTKALTLAEAANLIVKALGLTGEADLSKFADASTVPAWANSAIQALVAGGYIKGNSNNGVLTLGANDSLSRERLATFFVSVAVDTIEKEEAEATAIKEFTAVGAKKFEVEFDGAVDTTKAKFEVKKGSIKVNVEAVEWNDNKTVATIVLSGTITDGEYTVTVTDVAKEALTATVKTENERIDSISIPYNEAPIVESGSDRFVNVVYQIKNQYGEDVTNTKGTVTVHAAGAGIGTATLVRNGLVKAPIMSPTTTIGSEFVLTVVETSTGKSASQTIKLVAPAVPTSFEFGGVYQEKDKALTEDSRVSDNYYILVDVKDQYGNALPASSLVESIYLNNTNQVVKVDSTTTSGNSNAVAVFHTVTVDGKNKTALKITEVVAPGKTSVMLVSGKTGANASYTVEVAESLRAYSVELGTPELFVAGDTTFVPVNVYGKDGQAITDLDVINSASRGITVQGADGGVIKKDGVLGVEVTTKATDVVATLNAKPVLLTATPVVKTYTLLAAAKPVRVEGLTANAKTALLLGRDEQVINLNSVVLYDQYERVIGATKKASLFASDYSLVVTEEKAAPASGADTSAITLTKSTNSATVKTNAKGTEKVTIAIKDNKSTADVVAGSEKVITFTTTDGAEYVSYELGEIGVVADNSIHKDNAGSEALTDAAYDQEVAVYGVLANGSKVLLGNTEYVIAFNDADVTVNNGVIEVASPTTSTDSAKVNYDANGDGKVDATELTATVKLTVTILATGTQLTQDVTISRAGATPVKVVAVASGFASTDTVVTASQAAQAEALTSYITATAATNATVNVEDVVDYLVTDQYGVITLRDGNYAKYLATPAVPYSVSITGQTTNDLTITGLDSGEEVSVTATFAPGVTYTFKVVGK